MTHSLKAQPPPPLVKCHEHRVLFRLESLHRRGPQQKLCFHHGAVLKSSGVGAVRWRDLVEFTARRFWLSTVCPGPSQGRAGEGLTPPPDGQGHRTPPPSPPAHLCGGILLYPGGRFNQADTLPNTSVLRVRQQHKHLLSLPCLTVIHYRQRQRVRPFAFVVHMICG